MSEDGGRPAARIDYAALVQAALLELVHGVLTRAAEQGLPGDHHFYLTFATTHEGVELPPRLRRKFPEEMTIVLQHQYWNLQVDQAGFSVTLRFGGSPERVVVPWSALRSFADPSVQFGLQLQPAKAGAEAVAGTREPEPPAFASDKPAVAEAPPKPRSLKPRASGPRALKPDAREDPERGEARSPKIVDLHTFRRKPGGGATD